MHGATLLRCWILLNLLTTQIWRGTSASAQLASANKQRPWHGSSAQIKSSPEPLPLPLQIRLAVVVVTVMLLLLGEPTPARLVSVVCPTL